MYFIDFSGSQIFKLLRAGLLLGPQPKPLDDKTVGEQAEELRFKDKSVSQSALFNRNKGHVYNLTFSSGHILKGNR